MAIACPACNKPGQTAATCVRCGCDLTALHTIVEAAASQLEQAGAAFRRGDWRAALAGAEDSWRLYRTTESARMAFLAAAALAETAQAFVWHERSQ